MIWEDLKNWPGTVIVNGQKFRTVSDAVKFISETHQAISSITLTTKAEIAPEQAKTRVALSQDKTIYRISVRQYMTKPASPEFDFMAKWNNNNPMPLRTMVGTIEKETPGMLYMSLWGDITSQTTQYCMRCGKQITNPVSQFFGMGPECGGHNYVNPFESEEELKTVVENYRRNYLQKIQWTGWVIRSSIIEKELVEDKDE